jgi:hypothetical protein
MNKNLEILAENNRIAKKTDEIKSFLASLQAANFVLHSVDNGGGREITNNDIEKTLAEIGATDESYLFVSHPAHEKRAAVFIVLGNSPGELINDYTDWKELELVCSMHYDKFNQ